VFFVLAGWQLRLPQNVTIISWPVLDWSPLVAEQKERNRLVSEADACIRLEVMKMAGDGHFSTAC
jgi:hypothetical protein